jgi:hypothetical protein
MAARKVSNPKKVEDILKQNQKNISPKGVAAADAAAKKAIEDKYPGMFIPSTRRTAGVNRGN